MTISWQINRRWIVWPLSALMVAAWAATLSALIQRAAPPESKQKTMADMKLVIKAPPAPPPPVEPSKPPSDRQLAAEPPRPKPEPALASAPGGPASPGEPATQATPPPQPKPEPALASAPAGPASPVQPATQGTPPPQGEAAPSPAGTILRQERHSYVRAGEAFLESGKNLSDLPPVNGACKALDDCLRYSRAAGYRFLVRAGDRRTGRWLGELIPGRAPKLVDADLEALSREYPQKGRQIDNPALLDMAVRAAAGRGGGKVSLWALTREETNKYVAGKLLATMQRLGFERANISSIDALYDVSVSPPRVIFTQAILINGSAVPIADQGG